MCRCPKQQGLMDRPSVSWCNFLLTPGRMVCSSQLHLQQMPVHVSFHALMAVTVNSIVFWDVALCSLAEMYWCSGRNMLTPSSGLNRSQASRSWLWWWNWKCPKYPSLAYLWHNWAPEKVWVFLQLSVEVKIIFGSTHEWWIFPAVNGGNLLIAFWYRWAFFFGSWTAEQCGGT
jgi:hypothetical protein